MKEQSYGEILNYFKMIKSPEKVVPLTNDKFLVNALLAWKSVIIKYKQSNLFYSGSGNENEQWEWLWDNVNFEMRKFGIVAGLKVQDSTYYFDRLKGLKLIYPDGTIDVFASQYLNSVIMKTLGIKNSEKINDKK